jgi:hypothetical protein
VEEELIYDATIVRDQISYVHIERSLGNRLRSVCDIVGSGLQKLAHMCKVSL